MRGEYGPRAVFGSAPRVRGTLTYQPRIPQPPRISPACAGNTLYGAASPPLRGGQPRLRGEYAGDGRMPVRRVGSAPLAQGIPTHASGPGVSRRVSPACAGNTPGVWPSTRPNAGQPRTCGEYVDADTDQRGRTGLAPHMRGILPSNRAFLLPLRVSPAHAGNTAAGCERSASRAGQPRTCGEYRSCAAGRCGRGQPRTCGEYISPPHMTAGATGSAPHMREYLRAGMATVPAGGSAPHMREYSA